MRIGRILLQRGPKAPFPREGKRFDNLFVEPIKRKKAWDGQDKDAFFRGKYAHVHAKQLKLRKEEQERKQQKAAKIPPKPVANQAKPDFARQFAETTAKNPAFEYLFGTNAVRAVLEARQCRKLFTGLRSVSELDPKILALCRDSDVPIELGVPMQHLQIMSEQGNHNKYVVQAKKRPNKQIDSVEVKVNKLVINDDVEIPIGKRKSGFPLGLFIDQVTDAHNMGALLRSALFFGADFVAISMRNSSPISPVVVKASSGASEFVPVLECAHPLRLFDQLRNEGWSLVASAPNQHALKQHDISLTDVKPSELTSLNAPTLLVVGSEGDGIRTSLLQRSTHQTTLSTAQNKIGSLNVSVAAAVLLHAFHI